MTIVPTVPTYVSLKQLGVLAAVIGFGALFTLVNQNYATSASGTGSSGDQISASNLGVLNNPPAVQIDGTSISAGKGTTRVPTPDGTATVTVSGDTTSVDSTNGSERFQTNPSGNLNISVQSSSTNNGVTSTSSFHQTSSNNSSNTSTRTNSSSSVRVSGNGSAQVDIQTH
jgi:hypothetical protein